MLEDVANDDGDGNGDSVIDTLRPKDAELLEEIANRMDHDDILFGNPKWLENFREMKQATMDPLYKDGGKCPEHWTALRFNPQLLMCKAATAGLTLASTTCYVSLVTRFQRVTRCSPIPIERRSWSG
jgi:hypothetical protein